MKLQFAENMTQRMQFATPAKIEQWRVGLSLALAKARSRRWLRAMPVIAGKEAERFRAETKTAAAQRHCCMVIPQQLSTKEKNEMTYVNGAVHETAETPPVAMNQFADGNAQPEKFSPERRAEIKRELEQPFDPREIKWRVTATSMQQNKRGPQKRGQLIAYADQRAYTDRLNAVFGEWGWTRAYDVQVAQNFERKPHNDKSQSAIAAKVVKTGTD